MNLIRARKAVVGQAGDDGDSAGAVAAVDATAAVSTSISSDPFVKGLLSREAGQRFLDIYRNAMVSHFPFVVVSISSIEELHAQQPALCLAILTATSFEDAVLQRELGLMFNNIVSTRFLEGKFATLELLQALLVALAWSVPPPLEPLGQSFTVVSIGHIINRVRGALASN